MATSWRCNAWPAVTGPKMASSPASSSSRLRAPIRSPSGWGRGGSATSIGAASLSKSVVQDALAIAGFSAGLLLGLFALGILTPRVQQRSALGGFVAGLVVLLALKFGLPLIDESWAIAWPWYPVIGSLTIFVVAILFTDGRSPNDN